ncbi:MAG: hypothetical protein GY754_27400, partial [bacterium]|nr:hypothetical protein [bacterium]
GSEESAGDTELLNNLLTTAVGKNHIEVAEFLIEKGADYKIKIGVREETLLHKAAESGAVKQAEYFLNKGLSFNTPDKTALSPLDVAVNRNRPEVVQLFMNNGAKLKPVQSSRLLFASVEKGDIKTLEFLIEKGVNISAQHEQSRMTPLHYAASKGNLEIAKILLDKKANVNAPDQRGRTPLFNAIEKWKTHMVKLLLEKGASVDVKSTWKRTPMDEANRIPIEEHKKAIIALLNGAKK